ncbi:MAG TPA: helix-hairpin-helix domain-containing protein [Clostridiales bacterium]|nr:helix-hairpin-helix domain-containing protein [Clostridiales bacterium]
MNQKKTLIFIMILLFGAACFGGGALFGQHILVANGFVYAAAEADAQAETENGSTTTDAAAPTSTETDAAATLPININTAGYDELMSVKGIGEVTAGKILDARAEAGVFSDTYDLVTYGVMGDVKYSHLKDYLTVD